MTAIVFLARHGSHAEVGIALSGRSEIALDDAGRDEAARLADRLAGMKLAAVHSSPRARTRQTAEIAAAPHGLPVAIADALDEVDFGDWTGKSFAALADDPDWHVWNAERSRGRPPGGETMAAAVDRAAAWLAGLDGAGPILCVSHCDIIRGLAARAIGLPLDNLLRFDCDPGSLTTLADGGTRLVALNERPA